MQRRRALKTDVLSILEAIYAEAPGESAWIRGVLAAAGPLLDHGRGVTALAYALERGGDLVENLDHIHIAPAPGIDSQDISELVPELLSCVRGFPDAPALHRRLYPRYPNFQSFSRLSGLGLRWSEQTWAGSFWDSPRASEFWAAANASQSTARDALGLTGGNPSGHGILLMAATPLNPSVSPAEVALWTRIAAHLAAGYRLVRARTAPVDAVLDPEGRVAHLEPCVTADERSALSTAARAIEQARGKLRRTDAERAVALWKGLVAGRWTLVDQFDHDGRRYVLAKKNSPEVRPWASLNERENQVLTYTAQGQSQKIIAYLLGISIPSVSKLLSNAADKIGVRSRVELVAAYRRSVDAGPLPARAGHA